MTRFASMTARPSHTYGRHHSSNANSTMIQAPHATVEKASARPMTGEPSSTSSDGFVPAQYSIANRIAMVFITILFAMLYWAGTKPSLLVLLGAPVIGLALAFSTVAWGAWIIVLLALLLWWRPYVWEGLAVMLANLVMGVVAVPFWQRLAPYQQNRLLAFLNPQQDPRATGWHVIQSKIAIGSGGFLGQGFTQGPQKRLAFLPAQFTDFIFSVVGEELGFVGVLVALALLVALILILLRIARRATDPYSSLCVFGVAGLLFTHIIENVGMTVNLLPITGIPLPFFSYGGSFLLACSIAVGISLRVAWESRQSGYAEL